MVDSWQVDISTEVSLLQFWKASFPIFSTLLGRTMAEESFSQPLKAYSPIFVKLLGIVMDVRLVQPAKAQPSITSTSSGMVMDVRLVQFWKVPHSMVVCVIFDKSTEVSLLQL